MSKRHQCLDISAKRITFLTRVDFSNDQTAQLISNIQESFEGVVDLIGSDNEGNINFRNHESELEKQISLRLERNSISLITGEEFNNNEIKEMLSQLVTSLISAIGIFQKLLKHIGFDYIYEYKVRKNHYHIIHKLFYPNGPLNEIRKIGEENLTNDVKYSLALNNSCILIINAIGGQSEESIFHQSYEDENLRLTLSVGKVKELSTGDLSEISIRHFDFVSELVENKLMNEIIKPLEDLLI